MAIYIGASAILDVEIGGVDSQNGYSGPTLVWQREVPVESGEIVIEADGFLVIEADGFLVI